MRSKGKQKKKLKHNLLHRVIRFILTFKPLLEFIKLIQDIIRNFK